jgi:hypothetical protein
MARAAKDLPSQLVLKLFEQAFDALWRRTEVALGSVTLTAIVGRVLHNAAEKFPLFSMIRVEATGLHYDELRERLGELNGSELAEGMRFVLVEFLMILGNLTSDVLTPALHSALSRVVLGVSVSAEVRSGNQHRDQRTKRAKGARE